MTRKNSKTRSGGSRTSGRSSRSEERGSTSRSRKSEERSSSKRTRRGEGRRPIKKKADNTKLFIGLGIGAFVMLIVIVMAVSSKGTGGSGAIVRGEAGFLKLPLRKKIYAEYKRNCKDLAAATADGMKAINAEDRRKYSRMYAKQKTAKQAAIANRLHGKYSKKHKGLTAAYIHKYVVESGKKNNW